MEDALLTLREHYSLPPTETDISRVVYRHWRTQLRKYKVPACCEQAQVCDLPKWMGRTAHNLLYRVARDQVLESIATNTTVPEYL